MLLVTSRVDEFDRFIQVFSTKGAEKRRQYGCKGSEVYRDPSDDKRMWVVFDWDADGWASFTSDPDVPGIFQEAGLESPPEIAGSVGRYDT